MIIKIETDVFSAGIADFRPTVQALQEREMTLFSLNCGDKLPSDVTEIHRGVSSYSWFLGEN